MAPTRALISTLPHTSTQTLLGQEPVHLTLDPNSTFAKLTGVTTLNVFTANTENKTGGNLTAKTCGGLLFFAAASGTTPSSYNLVARRIETP